MASYEQWIRSSVVTREEIDAFLSPDEPSWAQYDAELGYTLGNYMPRDGVDGSLTISTSTPDGARRAAIYQDRDCRLNTYGRTRMFHGNFWANIEMDLENGELMERESLTPTPESLYSMADEEFMVDRLQDDLMLQMTLFDRGDTDDVDVARLNRLAEQLNCRAIDEGSSEMGHQVGTLRTAYAFAATRLIIDKAAAFADKSGKKLMLVLFCPAAMRQLIAGEPRYDQEIADYLQQQGHTTFDMNPVHEADYRQFDLSVDDYAQRYLIGHYSPAGNHFFAHSIKDAIVEWLDPKPITYREDTQARIDFRDGYLPES